MGKLFGTNGIRGRVGTELTPEFTVKVALAVGTYFNGGKLLVGCDGRTSSPAIKRAVISGLLASGCDVADAGFIPTPALQYGVKKFKFDGGVMITASHNPPEFNGIKVIGEDGIEISRERETEIEEIFFQGKFRRAVWNELGKIIETPNIIEEYINGIKRNVNYKRISSKEFKVLIDPGNGVSTLTIPKLLDELNCKINLINDTIDGRFPGRGAEPTPKTLKEVAKTVKALKCDLGVSYDGDGDRAIFTDELGVTHWGDKTGAIIEEYLLKKRRGIIVTPVSSSKLIEKIAEKYGGKVIWTRVGSVNVSHELKRVKGLMGMEENGGIIYPKHQYVRDGGMATALILEILSEENKTLSELIRELPKYYNFKEKVKCPNNLKSKVMEKVMKEVGRGMERRIETIDGVKLWIDDDTWILIRASGTEPIIRIYSEAKEERKARRNVEEYKRKVREIIKQIGG
mgnify:CR=1 FL=1